MESDKGKFELLKGSFLLAASSALTIIAYGFINFTKLGKIELVLVGGAFLFMFISAIILLKHSVKVLRKIAKGEQHGRTPYNKRNSGL